MTEDTADLIEAAQPNALLMRVDALCERRSWDEMVDLAYRCCLAVDRGKQLWPIAEHIDYRLALEGPGEYAAAVLRPDAGRFAHGPLTEVAASTHTFDDLFPHLDAPLVIGVVAAERVVRGEDLSGRTEVWAEVLEIPMVLQPWEPVYEVATYRPDKLHAPAPQMDARLSPGEARTGEPVEDPELHGALMELVTPWVVASNGQADVAVVEGPVEAAITELSGGDFRLGRIDARLAMALMGWAGASGGAHGRRRGAAAGRCSAWWAAAVLCDLPWPPEPAELGNRLAELCWYWFEPAGMPAGWNLNLAVHDPVEGWSAALRAQDVAEGSTG